MKPHTMKKAHSENNKWAFMRAGMAMEVVLSRLILKPMGLKRLLVPGTLPISKEFPQRLKKQLKRCVVVMRTIIKWVATLIFWAVTLFAAAFIGAMVVLYGSMYMIVAMVMYGTQTVFIATASIIALILLVILIRKVIKRRKRVYTWR